jgi:hypothetical protein
MTLQPSQNGGIVLVNEPSKKVMFDTWPDIQDQKSANWTLIPVIGRSEPIPVYQSSNARKISLKLRMVASSVVRPLPAPDESFEMEGRVNFLKSLLYPQRVGAFDTHPPIVWLICGEHINVKAFATTINVSYIDAPWDAIDDEVTRPLVADINLQFTIVNDFTVSSDVVRDAGDNYQNIHPSNGGRGRSLLRG